MLFMAWTGFIVVILSWIVIVRLSDFISITKEELVCEGYNSSRPNPLISNLKANKIISNRLFCHLVSVNDLDHDIPSTDLVPLVNEFLDVFPKELPGDPPLRGIDFVNEL